jgi:2-hydroxychromene-2-carboxylate isomerase
MRGAQNQQSTAIPRGRRRFGDRPRGRDYAGGRAVPVAIVRTRSASADATETTMQTTATQHLMHADFWFEFASTYSYPAAMRVEDEARRRGVALRWRPFLLGPIFKAQGWNDSPFNIYPAKGRYMWRDLERICAAGGLPIRRPSRFPRNGLVAARIAARFEHEPWIPEFVRAVYTANFAEDREISERDVVRSVLEQIGRPGSLVAEADSEEAKAKLRANTDEAIALGIFGAPTFIAGDELFWGNDRLEAALDEARNTAAHGSDALARP